MAECWSKASWKAAALALGLTLVLVVAPAVYGQNLTVRSVAVLKSAGQPEVEVKTSGPISPATQAVTGPDRIVIDFPGALPASTLRKLTVRRGPLKGIRTGLFQSQPPITRVVLDVDGPTDYQIVPSGNTVVIRLGRPDVASKTAPATPVKIAMAGAPIARPGPAAFRSVHPSAIPALQVVNTVSAAAPAVVVPAVVQPPRPTLSVAVKSNLLSIHARGATLAEVLYEVHRRTGADIAIPAGAEQERVVVDLPPAPGRDVIAALLNGSRFNYIVLGTDSDPGGFRNLLLSVKDGGGSSGVFVHTVPPPANVVPGQPSAMMQIAEPAPQQQPDPNATVAPGPELEPIPEDTSANEAETSPDGSRPVPPQQVPIQNIPEAGQVPQ